MDNSAFAFEKALKSKTKKDILAEKLIEMIQTGLLRDGDVLPSERDLASLFEVSRETVRGGLSLLAAHGLVHVSHGSKTRVLGSDNVLASFGGWDSGEPKAEVNHFDVDSVFEGRLVVESAIVRRAALKIDAAGIAKLEAMLKNQQQLFDSPVHFQLSDRNFHRLISEYASNNILLRYAEELYSYGLHVRRQVLLEEGAIERSFYEHSHIVDALRRGDPDAADRAMLTHLDSVYRTTSEKLGVGISG